MTIAEERALLEKLRAQIHAGQSAEAIETIDRSLQEIDRDRLLTTTQAARLLHIGSVNTLKMMCRKGDITTVKRGNRTMIPLAEIERIQESETMRGIRASDRAHESFADLGDDQGLTEEQMADLEVSRPGRLPWMT